jgi:hypothetical protein
MANQDALQQQLEAAIGRTLDGTLALVQEARAEAEAEVKRQLVDLMTQAMLRRAREELESSVSAPGSPARESPPPAVEARLESLESGPAPLESRGTSPRSAATSAKPTVLYAYCVIDAFPEDDVLEGAVSVDPAYPPRLITQGSLAALVSEVPSGDFDEEPLRGHLDDPEWLARITQRHEALLELLGSRATAVPLRTCTVLSGESGVRELLLREANSLSDALAHLEGRTEWRVKVLAATCTAHPFEQGLKPDPGHERRLGPPSGYERLNRQEELWQATEVIHEQLCRAAVQHERLTLHPGDPSVADEPEESVLLDAAYLVNDEDLSRFLALIEALRLEHGHRGMVLDPTGPSPAHHFLPDGIGAAW